MPLGKSNPVSNDFKKFRLYDHFLSWCSSRRQNYDSDYGVGEILISITSVLNKKRRAVSNFAHSTSQKSNGIANNQIRHYNVAFDFMQMRNGEEPHLHIGKVESQNLLCDLVACARKGLEIGFRSPVLRMLLFTSGIRLFIFDPKKTSNLNCLTPWQKSHSTFLKCQMRPKKLICISFA